MKKETMKATCDGYIYKGVHIRKQMNRVARSWETTWHADGRVFNTLREARQHIDQVRRIGYDG